MNQSLVYLNGEYKSLKDAKISVLDRGFLFGDGVYEVIPAYKGELFYFSDHVKRLQHSLQRISLEIAYDSAKWQNILTPLLDKNRNQAIYLQVTRGVAAKRDHVFPETITPTIFAMANDIQSLDSIQTGIKAVTLDDSRWGLCDVKATTLLANVLLKQQASEQQCAEAILTKAGNAIEGAASNLFIILNNSLITPPKSSKILAGITRQIVLELAYGNGLKVDEREITLAELQTANEIWLTSSTREIMPVVELDGNPVATGKVGLIWQKMNTWFQNNKTATL